jgi:uncharacterized protein YprB with RNaseH-like and TPR domain
MGAPRVCFIDIETAPIKGYAWGMFETNLVHVIEPTYILCYAIKWQGESKIKTHALPDYPGYSKNKKSDKALCADLWKDLDRADIAIAHNGDAFDIKKINSRLIVHGLPKPSPFKTVDTLKIARREFKFDSNKLDNIGRYLQLGRKMPHTGMDLWLGCMDRDDPKSWRVMRKYNAQDIVLLENVYEQVKGWDKSHPSMTAYDDAPGCPTCRSKDVQRRGLNVAKTRKSHRMHCQGCGAWFSEPIKKGVASDRR